MKTGLKKPSLNLSGHNGKPQRLLLPYEIRGSREQEPVLKANGGLMK